MLASIARILEEMIPAVSADALGKFKRDFQKHELEPMAFTMAPKEELVFQGDIIRDMPFTYYNKDGTLKHKKSFGMMLSYSCDMANLKKNVVFAFCIPASDYTLSNFDDARNQRITNLMFLPTRHILNEDLIVDFNLVTTYSSQFVDRIMKEKNHIVTLRELGNFLFLTKLTIHFFRVEPL